MKKIIILLIIVGLFIPAPVFADDDVSHSDIWMGEQFLEAQFREMSFLERLVVSPIMWATRALSDWLQLELIETVVFMWPVQPASPEDMGLDDDVAGIFGAAVLFDVEVDGGRVVPASEVERNPLNPRGSTFRECGVFTDSTWNLLERFHGMFLLIAFSLLTISIITTGFRIGLMSGNPKGREESKEALMNLGITVVLMALILPLAVIVMQFNKELVFELTRFLPYADGQELAAHSSFSLAFMTDHWLSTILLRLVIFFLTLYINVLYTLRKFMILVLLIVSPLVIWAWGKGRQTSLYLWLAEFGSNVFMQSVHALLLVVFLQINSL